MRAQLVALVDETLQAPLAGDASSPAASVPDGQATTVAPSLTDGGVEMATSTEGLPPAALAARVAAAGAYGRSMAAEIAARRPAPQAMVLPPGLRNRVWVATECGPHAGMYARSGAAAAVSVGSQPTGLVRGFASVAEADGYIGCLGCRVPDRR